MRNSLNEDKDSGAPRSKLAKVSSGNSVPDFYGTKRITPSGADLCTGRLLCRILFGRIGSQTEIIPKLSRAEGYVHI